MTRSTRSLRAPTPQICPTKQKDLARAVESRAILPFVHPISGYLLSPASSLAAVESALMKPQRLVDYRILEAAHEVLKRSA